MFALLEHQGYFSGEDSSEFYTLESKPVTCFNLDLGENMTYKATKSHSYAHLEKVVTVGG